MKLKILKMLLCLPILPLAWSGCGYDHGLDPIQTRVTGDVIFTGPTPPYYVREAVVIIVKKLPPDNLLTDIIFSDPLPFNTEKPSGEDDTLHYELVADPGVYAAAGVLWRKKGEAWDIANILGVYLDPKELFTLKKVVVSNNQPIADSVNIIADWTYASRDAFIEGDITYKDDWPVNSGAVAVAAIGVIPPSGPAFLPAVLANLRGLNFTLPLFVKSTHYRLAVNSGEIKFLSLFWYGKGEVLNIRTVGLYHCPGDTLPDDVVVPKSVRADKDATVTGVDFEVYFSTLPVGVRYCKDCPPCDP